MEYFSIITTCKQFQVIRFFAVHTERKVCQPAKYSINEVVQRWIAPDGKTETVARLRCQSLFYCDLWNECSSMEIRSNKTFRAYDIDPICTYPTIKVIPEAIRNGYKGNFHNILPYDFFTAILSDSRKETLLKSGQTEMLRHSIVRTMDLQRYWNSIKIWHPQWLYHSRWLTMVRYNRLSPSLRERHQLPEIRLPDRPQG